MRGELEENLRMQREALASQRAKIEEQKQEQEPEHEQEHASGT